VDGSIRAKKPEPGVKYHDPPRCSYTPKLLKWLKRFSPRVPHPATWMATHITLIIRFPLTCHLTLMFLQMEPAPHQAIEMEQQMKPNPQAVANQEKICPMKQLKTTAASIMR
jgi:hypothetical protein